MIGQTLNKRYKITAPLGKGAMGTVYKAVDSQSGRDVALKVISGELDIEPEILERFKREGETLRQLKHPNIVEFLDAFEYQENYVIVMEYISGGSLHDLIKKGALSIEHSNRISLGLCDALIRSHNLGIIHRDLKPENILLAEDGTPKLADFGIARLNEGTRMTRSGTQVGTPYYMSPEAWEGKTLDAQADIWSLGVVLFEMLTGKVPFGGDTGAAVMNKVLTTTPPNLKTLRNEVPSEIAKIVSRMLARDKRRRYQTMREVAVELERGQLIKAESKSTRWLPRLSTIGLILIFSGFWYFRNANNWQKIASLNPIQTHPAQDVTASSISTQTLTFFPALTATDVKVFSMPLVTELAALSIGSQLLNYDFESPGNYLEIIQDGNWNTNEANGNGLLVVDSPLNGGPGNLPTITFGLSSSRNFIFQFRFNVKECDTTGFFGCRIVVTFRNESGQAYVLLIDANSDQAVNGHVSIEFGGRNGWVIFTQGITNTLIDLPLNTWHEVLLIANADNISAAVDGTRMVLITDDRLKTGDIGLEVGANTTVEIDDISAWSILPSSP